MRIELIQTNGLVYLKLSEVTLGDVIEFPPNETGETIYLKDARLIFEGQEELEAFEKLLGDRNFVFLSVDESAMLVHQISRTLYPGDILRLKIPGYSDRACRSCSNCEYFTQVGEMKICNGALLEGTNTFINEPRKENDCAYWVEVNHKERSLKNDELRSRVTRPRQTCWDCHCYVPYKNECLLNERPHHAMSASNASCDRFAPCNNRFEENSDFNAVLNDRLETSRLVAIGTSLLRRWPNWLERMRRER